MHFKTKKRYENRTNKYGFGDEQDRTRLDASDRSNLPIQTCQRVISQIKDHDVNHVVI